MKKPHLIEAIIGNTSVLAQLDSNGILQRFYWPSIDYDQQVKLFLAGAYIDGLIFFEDERYKKSSGYKDDFSYFFEFDVGNNKVFQLDFIDFETDALIRYWKTDLSSFYVFFEPMINAKEDFNAAKFDKEDEIVILYHQGTYLAIGFQNKIESFTIKNGIEDAKDNTLEGIEEGVNPQIAIKISSQENITMFVAFGRSYKQAKEKILRLRKKGFECIYQENRKIWNEKIGKLNFIKTQDPKDLELQKRSSYVFYILQNSKTGGIIAAPEVDEKFTMCGGYGFSWGRDAAFITGAMDKLGMDSEVEKFFEFKFSCQEEEGFWDQRYYTDANLAPSWGIQIDETASIIWGFINHCEEFKRLHLIERYKESLGRALKFLLRWIEPEKGFMLKSYDLWEERQGIHLYSNASIYAALKKSLPYFEDIKDEIERKMKAIKTQMKNDFYNDKLSRYVRSINLRITKEEFLQEAPENRFFERDKNFDVVRYYKLQDEVIDASLLGLYYPFEMVEEDDITFQNVIRAIEDECKNDIVGGYKRYANDKYVGGNPWIITTLWLAIYYKKMGNLKKAEELFGWAKDHAMPNGLLPEQVDKITGMPSWVVPLAWSHAMYILYLHEQIF